MDSTEREIDSMRVELNEIHVVLDEIQDELRASGGQRNGELNRSEREARMTAWEGERIEVWRGGEPPRIETWTKAKAGCCAYCRHGMWTRGQIMKTAKKGELIMSGGEQVKAMGVERLLVGDVPQVRCLVSYKDLTGTVRECTHLQELPSDHPIG